MNHGVNKWLVENTRQVQTLESVVRTLTTFVPGQLQQIEVLSEASNAAIQGLGYLHDAAVVDFLRENHPKLVTAHAKYIESMNRSKVYAASTAALSSLQATELLIEMIARQRKGERGRWNAVLSIESVKVGLKLVALAASGRPLAHSAIYEKTLDPDQIEALLNQQQLPVPEVYVMPRTSKQLPAITSAPQRLSESVLGPESVLEPKNYLKPLTSLAFWAELLSIVRPLVYALAAYRYRRQKTWKPWVIGIIVEFLSRQLTEKVIALRGRRHATQLENELLRSKTASLKWWALRGEFYSRVTRPFAAKMAKRLDKIPVLSIAGLLITDSLYLWDDFYFSSSSA